MSRTPPRLLTLILLTAMALLSLNMMLPALASIAEDLESPFSTVSLAVSGYLAITALVYLVVGPLSDRVGRRPVALGILIIFIVTSLGAATAQTVEVFLAFRLGQAVMIAGSAVSLAVVRDTTEERAAASKIGSIGMAMALAPMLGPMLGGALDTMAGWRAGFYAYAIAGAALLALVWVDLGETRQARPRSKGAIRQLLRAPRFWAFAITGAFSTGSFYIFLTGAALVAATVFQVSSATLGLYVGSITAGFMTGSFLSSRLAARQRPAVMLVAGRLVGCTGLIIGLAITLAGAHTPLLYFGATIFVGLGNGITMPSAHAGAMSVRPDLAGSAAGLSGAINVGIGAGLTAITGWALTEANAAPMLLALMLGSALTGLCTAFWLMHLDRIEPRPQPH